MWDKLEELLLWIPKKIWAWILEQVGDAIDAIPVPSFFSDASSALSRIPSEVGYFIEPLNLGTGISMIITAYVIRFTIRRIPIIG